MKKILLIFIGAFLAVIVLATGFVVIRGSMGAARVRKEWNNADFGRVSGVGEVTSFELVPVFEEAGDTGVYQTGHGVSYYIKTSSGNILMDLGMADPKKGWYPAESNMQQLGIEHGDYSTVFISHRHPDHTGGIQAWLGRRLDMENPVLLEGKTVYLPDSLENSGKSIRVFWRPEIIAPGIASSGTILYKEVFPLSIFSPAEYEQALVIKVKNVGLILVSGCGHPGVERLVVKTEKFFGEPVRGIIGGLHYEGLSREDVQDEIAFLKERNPVLVALSPHDSSPEAIAAFRDAFPDVYREIETGKGIRIQK